MTYDAFGYSDLRVGGGETVTARFTIRNTGTVRAADVPQFYLVGTSSDPKAGQPLIGFIKVTLGAGEQ